MQWLKDGRFIVKEWRPDGSTPVMLLEPGASNSKEILLYERGGGPFRLSPDERWLAYATPASGTSQVYVKSMAPHGTAVRVSNDSGIDPVWSSDGNELYFRHGPNLVAVSLRKDGERVAVGSEQMLFQLPTSSALYGISPDGRRFLVGRQVDPPPVPGIRVVLNWFEELKGRGREK